MFVFLQDSFSFPRVASDPWLLRLWDMPLSFRPASCPESVVLGFPGVHSLPASSAILLSRPWAPGWALCWARTRHPPQTLRLFPVGLCSITSERSTRGDHSFLTGGIVLPGAAGVSFRPSSLPRARTAEHAWQCGSCSLTRYISSSC